MRGIASKEEVTLANCRARFAHVPAASVKPRWTPGFLDAISWELGMG